jgi:hypothetical protein
MSNEYITKRCYSDNKPLSIPTEVFDEGGFIRQKYKGRVLTESIPQGVQVGEIVFYCSDNCRDECLGPRPKKLEKSSE